MLTIKILALIFMILIYAPVIQGKDDPLTVEHLTDAQLVFLTKSLGLEIAYDEDRAAARAAGVEWREVSSYEEILRLVADFRSRTRNATIEISGDVSAVAIDMASASSSTQTTREATLYDTLTCDAIMGARINQSYDPIAERVQYSPPVHEKWWDSYGVCVWWLEDKSHTVEFPNGALKQSASATKVMPVGPVVLKERISGTVWW